MLDTCPMFDFGVIGRNNEMATHSLAPRESDVVNIASVPLRSPFRYPGGKTWLVPRVRDWLRSLRPQPRELAEPFAGGGIVGLTALFENFVQKLVFVEKDEDVASVWEVVINGEALKLAQQILRLSGGTAPSSFLS
jgi:D12 class N6 adenine-specific DNA methyltransferase